ncbi:McrB family protein [Nocardia sputi]|uniref:McrB family protein n=1 Tax=Nocardia sputi TaxID=2943705 RepID=UPI0020BDB8E2|nr:AAA family ATPase [Nocardia sputi]
MQLTAELVYLHLLAPSDIGGAAKHALLHKVLALTEGPVAVPADLDAALYGGFASAGMAYRMRRDQQLLWLVRFLVTWKKLPADARRGARADPWAFRGVADSFPIDSAYSQRNALLHLVFPGIFEPIVSREHKQKIVDGLADDIPNATGDVDRDLAALRAALEQRRDCRISFYSDDLHGLWRRRAIRRTARNRQRGWAVRQPKDSQARSLSEWLAGRYCALSDSDYPGLRPELTPSQMVDELARRAPGRSAKQRSVMAWAFYQFANEMSNGDLIATVDGVNVYVGIVAGPAAWTAAPTGFNEFRRDVRWLNTEDPVTRDELSPALRGRLAPLVGVGVLRAGHLAELATLVGVNPDLNPAETGPEPVMTELAELPEPTAEFADELFIDVEWLSETVDLLRESKQLILYGPPGTGKTYLALELAQYLSEQSGGEHRLVQFHPSYSYEDFFEGFRPQRGTTAGMVSFDLESGPLKLLVDEANKDLTRVFVLVIDEINRANLAKVFGELYFLLEYRDRAVQLQYSPTEEFRLPPNLYIIGTMNTADRSIALVDAAMRRRFAWQGLFPSEVPVEGMLRRWLEANEVPVDRADLLDALNDRIADRDVAIGPSYLMTPRAGTEAGLARIWKHHIMPLLEERHIGEGIDVHARYGLDALRNGTATRPQQQKQTAPEEETGERAS